MANTTTKPKRELKILSLGLPRTGTASMCEALTVLGYQNVYHGIKSIENSEDWTVMNRAADASFPNLPTYNEKPFTRAQWDELFGSCEGATDMASVFAQPLIETYPEAKVILVERDFDRWFKSIDEGVLSALWSPAADFNINYVEPILNSQAGVASRKMMLGLFQAQNVDEARQNARAAWERHHKTVRELVPAGQLLDYRLGDGWEPLCEFLGCPVPDVEFPHVNEAAELRRVIAERIRAMTLQAAMKILPWAGGVAVMGIGAWMMVNRGS